MKVKYFARVRERIGVAEEDVSPPASVVSAADLIAWLASRGENYAAALGPDQRVRVAIDQRHAASDAPVGDAREVALFPPMTGG